MLPMMAWMGMLSPASILLGGVLLVPYGVASWIGQMLFDPDRQGLYRAIAYAIIGAAILLGLPIYS